MGRQLGLCLYFMSISPDLAYSVYTHCISWCFQELPVARPVYEKEKRVVSFMVHAAHIYFLLSKKYSPIIGNPDHCCSQVIQLTESCSKLGLYPMISEAQHILCIAAARLYKMYYSFHVFIIRFASKFNVLIEFRIIQVGITNES